jgi:hypothetical protein
MVEKKRALARFFYGWTECRFADVPDIRIPALLVQLRAWTDQR